MQSCSISKGKGLRVWFAPTECSWAEIRKVHSKGISQLQPGAAGRPETVQNGE